MPAFTAIGAYVATSLFGLAAGSLAAAVVGGIVATGAAMLTSRLINGSPGQGGGGQQQNTQGTRVQLSPSTENKVPVLYGSAYCNAIVTDAYLSDDNQVMTYVMVIAETCNVVGATYTVEDIYWNDMRLYFGNADDHSRATQGRKYNENLPDPLAASGPFVQIANEDFVDDKFDDKVYINIYAGNTSSAKQIFGKTQNAWAITGLADDWTNRYQYEGFITAVVSVHYDSEKGFTGLPTLTFKLKNSVDNPALVLADYMTSDRYGANIALANINSTALTEFQNFCNDLGPYKPYGWQTGDPILTQKRYTINGLIDTNRSCKENIDTILLNSGAWMSYDVADGTWRVIPKKALDGTTWSGDYQTGTPTDPSPQIIFNDDNILSGIEISSTRLDNLYNGADVEYFDKYNKDQRGYVSVYILDEQRNANEPDNNLRLALDLVNSNIQAERLANIELKQSRDDLVIKFTAAHYGIQAQAGDVIAVYNTIYGWCEPSFPSGKYFRVLATVERETSEGQLTQEIQAIEYNSDVYSNESTQEFTTVKNIGIIPRESDENIPAPTVEVTNKQANSGAPNFQLRIKIPDTGGPFDELQIYYAEGDDWAGTGGDTTFKGQIFGTVLDVIQHNSPNPLRANAETAGVYTEITGTNVLTGTYVTNFGATGYTEYGNGKTGRYTVTPSHPTNTAVQTMYGFISAAKFTGTVSGKVLTVTSVSSGTVQLNSLIRKYSDVSTGKFITTETPAYTVWNAVIKRQLTGTTGGAGTYELLSTPGNITTATSFVDSKPYPLEATYTYFKSVYPNPESNGLFNQTDIRSEVIIGLPPNSTNKKYFIKCRLGVGKEFGPFSEILEVDLETPTVYWEPDSKSALNIKTELVKMDFGKFTIPRNGVWLMRTATQLDGGTLANYNSDYFNLDLGNFSAEAEIASDDEIQDFRYDPD